MTRSGAFALLTADTAQTARAFEEISAPLASVGGFSISAVRGKPDNGLLDFESFVSATREITSAAPGVHFLVDAEAGYGNPERTIAELCSIPNIAIVFIEDQIEGDKRCGHMDRHAIVPVEQMSLRIESALAGRKSSGYPIIMARTDARSAEGSIEAAIARGKRYLEAGAEALFIEAPRSRVELEQVAKSFPGIPLMANLIEGGKTPELSFTELEQMGFRFIARPVATSLVYSRLMREMAREFYQTGELNDFYATYGKPELEEFRNFIGLANQ